MRFPNRIAAGACLAAILLGGGVMAEPTQTHPTRFDELWNFNDPAGTEAAFRDLRPRVAALGDEGLLLQLDTQIARTLSLQRRFDEAHALLDGIEPKLDGQPAVVTVRYLLERGRTLNSSGKRDEAKEVFLQATEAARDAGEDGFAVDAAHMVAIVEEPDAAITWNVTALEWAKNSDDEAARKWIGSLHNNLGWTHHGRKDYEHALTHFEEALMFHRRREDRERTEIAEWTVARCLRSLGQLREALLRQQDLLKRKEAAGETDVYVLEEIGECLWALGREEEARPWLAKAWEQLSQDPWLVEGEPERLESLKERAGDAATQ